MYSVCNLRFFATNASGDEHIALVAQRRVKEPYLGELYFGTMKGLEFENYTYWQVSCT